MTSEARQKERRAHRGVRVAWTEKWSTATLGPVDIVLVVTALTTMSILRSVDYATGDWSSLDGPDTITAVEAAAPVWAWASAFGVGAALLAVGVSARWHGFVWLGHSLLGTLYAALLAGMAESFVTDWGGDGARWVGVLVLPTLMHILLAFRTGPRPLKGGAPKAVIMGAE